MHQSHNIPWDLLAQHFEPTPTPCRSCLDKIPLPPHENCPSIFLRLRDKPTQISDLTFFCARIIRALTAFSTTARAKHLLVAPPISTDPLWLAWSQRRDEYLACYAGMSVDRYREAIDNGAAQPYVGKSLPRTEWRTGDVLLGGRTEVIKALLDEGCGGEQEQGGEKEKTTGWEVLLGIARDESQQVGKGTVGEAWYEHIHGPAGWRAVGRMALAFYLLVNTIMAVPGLLQPDAAGGGLVAWKRWNEMRWWFRDPIGTGNAHMLPHEEFWRAVGLPEECFQYSCTTIELASVDLFKDMARVQDYLKHCWRLMYGYDMLMRECGMEPDWADLLTRSFYERGVELDVEKIKSYSSK